MTRTPTWWHCRGLRADGSVATFSSVQSTRHSDLSDVDVPESEVASYIGDEQVDGVVTFDEAGAATSVQVLSPWAADAPPLWWLELDEPPEQVPHGCALLAFTGHDVEPGSVLGREAVRGLTVASKDQLAAIRWYPATGEIDQIYVAPPWRRRAVATALGIATMVLTVARGNPRLWADGQRTADGERLRNARDEWRHFAADQTHLHPPMTPYDQR